MSILKKLFGFLRLYHPHAVVLYPFSYLLGAYAASDASALDSFNLLVAALLGGISLNFVYVLNSWFDADIDSVNKPHRPIPSGVITEKEAWNYALILLALAVIYPFALFGFSPEAFLFLWFPIAGSVFKQAVSVQEAQSPRARAHNMHHSLRRRSRVFPERGRE
jgi:4-hydroxybenzoate polyprenyltransferase